MTQSRKPKAILVTGGAGFIGSNFIRSLFNNKDFDGFVVNCDSLTYAGNLESLDEVEREFGGKRYFFQHTNINDRGDIEQLFIRHSIDTVVHFAAESHVDRSIHGPGEFIQTNIVGTFNVLESARNAWKDKENVLFYHISTDEVYGSLGDEGHFYEHTPYSPNSPYSASKASADHLVRAYFHTYGLPVVISNCSNNYGPYQFPEKLIPLMILNAMEGKNLPIYGDGKNVRDWLYVGDHCSAITRILSNGRIGETYNIGGENEQPNIDIVHQICDILQETHPPEGNGVLSGKGIANYRDLITYVKDRPGHDRRYAVNCDKLKNSLDWKPSVTFEEGLRRTIQWYLDHEGWIQRIRSGEYSSWMEKNYGKR
jgi:dTDP-glucose 4,6-dehydratase